MQKSAHKFEGKTFFRLTVMKRLENHVTTGGHIFSKWLCQCVCGSEVSVIGIDLKSGKVKSCGCLHREISKQLGEVNKIHGGYSNQTSVDDQIKYRTLVKIKERARRRGYDSDLELKDLPQLTDRCPVFGIKYKKGQGGLVDASPSIDRVDSGLPYLKKYKDNLVYISHKANRIKNNATIRELEAVLNFVKSMGHSAGSENSL